MTSAYDSTPRRSAYDAVVVGSGPNGLAAAATLARAGWSVLVMESHATLGGGLRSEDLTLPGFTHDVCSSIHALATVSPFFQSLPADKVPLKWAYPIVPCAHPLDDGGAAALYRSPEETADALGGDAHAYRRTFAPLARRADVIFPQALAPLRPPRTPLTMARFGVLAVRSAEGLARRFSGGAARALIAGMAAHGALPLDRPMTAAVAMMLMLSAHAGGWPVCVGGSQKIAQLLADYVQSLGGEIVVNSPVTRLHDIPSSRAVLFDTVPRTLLAIAGEALPAGYRRSLERFRHGVGVYKVDWALDGPIPWRDPVCRQAGTVHVGGTLEEIAQAEQAPWRGVCSERPFVLLTQPSLFDPTRAPPGKHTAWGYCRVPPGAAEPMTERIEAQVERFAPGFRDRILTRCVTNPQALEAYNANYVGGDITGGVMDWRQVVARPALRWNPYATPNPRLFLCSASTPPGPGVHGMCGYYAAQAAMRRQS